MHLHSKNININKIFEKLDEKINQVEFVNLITFIQKDISEEEVLILYKKVANADSFVYIK